MIPIPSIRTPMTQKNSQRAEIPNNKEHHNKLDEWCERQIILVDQPLQLEMLSYYHRKIQFSSFLIEFQAFVCEI